MSKNPTRVVRPSEFLQLFDTSWIKAHWTPPPNSKISGARQQPQFERRLGNPPDIPSPVANQVSNIQSTSSPKPQNSRNGENPVLPSPRSQYLTDSKAKELSLPNQEVPFKFALSEEQNRIKELVEQGQNVFFTGGAGTGKSTLLQEIIETLRRNRSAVGAVVVTASTGIAACNLGGVTIHHFSGIGLGTEPLNVLVQKVNKSYKALERWRRANALVIDEVSMISADLFEKLSAIGSAVRNNREPFGGIQVVVTGDFFQLPPVAKNKDEVQFAFESTAWKKTFTKSLSLRKVFRQCDPEFIRILNEMRIGRLSNGSILKLQSLRRPIDGGDDFSGTELQEEVERANNNRLSNLKTREVKYISKDGGNIQDPERHARLLGNFRAVNNLVLRLNAAVMLIKNVDAHLVNGSVGTVVAFRDPFSYLTRTENGEVGDGIGSGILYPEVQFRSGSLTITRLISPETWDVKLPNGEVEASRTQLPLVLAWAMSIHKSQGQSLERVKVDLGRVFERGQAYVAVSRATSFEGLQILNFNPKKVMAHPKVVEWSSTHETIS